MKIIRNYGYRLYPTPTQERDLDLLLSLAWRTYNDALNTRIVHYRETGESLSHFAVRDIMCAGRKQHPDSFGLLMYDTVDALCKRMIDAYTGAFSRLKAGKEIGLPGPVKRRDFRNIPFVYGSGVKLIPGGVYNTHLRVTNVGHIPLRYHRPIPDFARIKRVMLVRSKRGKWYAVVTVDLVQPEAVVSTNRAIGLDIGIRYLLAGSDGSVIENPKWHEVEWRRRRVLQRKLDRQRRSSNPNNYNADGTVRDNAKRWKKSNRQRKTEDQLRKLEEKVARRRKNFWHEVTERLTAEYDFIAIEDLSLEFMQKNKRLALSVYDASYATFWSMLEYKASSRGVRIVRVPPQYTSQTCSVCGYVDRDNRKTQAEFCCVSCGHEENADINAAKNILNRAVNGVAQAPQGVK